jgi:uncharacterized protein with PIN domain
MKFLADTMLGRLATWLRLLGYDTRYEHTASDAHLAHIARAENRILLTRDVELTRRRGIHAALIESEQVEEQVRQVFRAFNLTARQAFSRCAECNCLLEEVSPEAVRGVVPPYVFHTQTRFRRCPQCARVYWRGTHWARIIGQLHDLDET